MKLHYKTFKFEIKASSEKDGKGTISGYGSIFNNIDSYGDVVVPGAFKNALNSMRDGQIKMLWQHYSDMPIGVWKNLKEDTIGLVGEAEMPLNIPGIAEKYEMAKAGLVDGLSIGYRVRPGGMEMNNDVCYLKDLDLREISLVTFPANPLALISDVKNRSNLFDAHDVCDLLCGLGYKKQDAKLIVDKFMNGEQLEQKSDSAILDALKKLNSTLRGNL